MTRSQLPPLLPSNELEGVNRRIGYFDPEQVLRTICNTAVFDTIDGPMRFVFESTLENPSAANLFQAMLDLLDLRGSKYQIESTTYLQIYGAILRLAEDPELSSKRRFMVILRTRRLLECRLPKEQFETVDRHLRAEDLAKIIGGH